MPCRCLGGWGHRDGRSREKCRDEDRDCNLLQWRSHTVHPALLYMQAQLRSVMMSMLYPMYNWAALKPGKVQDHTCISSQQWTSYIFQYKVTWMCRTVTMPSTYIDKHGLMLEIHFASISSNISPCPYSNFNIYWNTYDVITEYSNSLQLCRLHFWKSAINYFMCSMYMHLRMLYTYVINQQIHIINIFSNVLLPITNIFQSLFWPPSDGLITRIQTICK